MVNMKPCIPIDSFCAVWLGIFVSCLNGYSTMEQYAMGVVGVAFSPIFLMQTSLPWLEHLADVKYGASEKYWE